MPSEDFDYTGGWRSFKVPDGVTSITVVLMGGGSGSARGGKVTGKLAVTPGRLLWLAVGDGGHTNIGSQGGTSCFGGGGAGGRANNGTGGDGGGGATVLRSDSTSGTLKAVAGGSGGTSGDGGRGGSGGTTTGESGEKASGTGDHPSKMTKAGGGSQSTAGEGGTSDAGKTFNGTQTKFPKQILQVGGSGGAPPSNQGNTHGGGGGGGGYHPGGGGAAAARAADIPGGGGGGGSNYVGGLTAVKNERGTGSNHGGSVKISWNEPPEANVPPNPPTNVTIGVPGDPHTAESDVSTRSTGTVRITAALSDQNIEDTVRMLVRLSSLENFATSVDIYSGWYGNQLDVGDSPNLTVDAIVDLNGLSQDVHYYARLFSQDNRGLYSENFNSVDFWTNRGPQTPETISPAENANLLRTAPNGFSWSFIDDDTGDAQSGFQLQYRQAPTVTTGASAWITVDGSSTIATSWTAPPSTFKGNTFYEWQVRNKDLQGRWSDWSFESSFFVIGVTVPPIPLSPVQEVAVDTSDTVTFAWRFQSTNAGDTQSRADIRYRVSGQDDGSWITLAGGVNPAKPGTTQSWALPGDRFASGYCWEWQVRTYDQSAVVSDWSASAEFWSIDTPGSAVVSQPPVAFPIVQGSLGCGSYRVFIYDQGGRTPRGEIEPLSSLTFSRKRDDISTCLLTTNGFGADCCQMYANLRCWAHELVVFRDGKRVWEGPITRIGYEVDQVEIEAKDVMAYLYRRIMRQGYNDSFQMVDPNTGLPVTSGGVQLGLTTVVKRATRIAMNALAPYDPNVLPYLTALTFADDARQSRVVADYSQTAWEQIDDLAATAGLDYTVVGRRILLWDTHRAIGRLPEMRDQDFNNPPVVTEYGMQTANYVASTNGSGIWGAVRPPTEPTPNIYYGPVEMIASAYDESSAATDEALTPAARQALVNQLTSQAGRNIAGRWPSPIIVRVPDNSTLNPNIGVGFDQLVPGVWIPLRSTGTCREVAQWQKLDSVNVVMQASGGEQVQVVMSPAPNFGLDPDAEAAAAEDA